MDGNRFEDLQRMHTLFSIVNALESLRQALSSYIRRTGQGIIMDEEKDKEMVASLLEFKAYLDTIWEESFFKNKVFCNTIRDAFEHLINLRQNRPAELIAKFLDEKLRVGNKATSEDLKRNWRECLTKSWFYSGLYRAEIMSALKRAADGGMVEPNRVDVTQVCVNRIEQWNGMEIQASGEVEDEGIAVLQNNGTDYEIGYRPCMGNVTGFSK